MTFARVFNSKDVARFDSVVIAIIKSEYTVGLH